MKRYTVEVVIWAESGFAAMEALVHSALNIESAIVMDEPTAEESEEGKRWSR